MSISDFIDGPLLWAAILFFAVAFLMRGVHFTARVIQGLRNPRINGAPRISWAAWFPLHRAVTAKPLYASIRWIFHIGIVVLPVFFGGHIVLWEMSRFEWSWAALPYAWADGLTLLLLGLCLYFIIRRVAIPEIRKSSRFSEWLVVWLVALPLLSGYMLTHGGPLPDVIKDNLYSLHILFGEIMLIGAGFLFVGLKMSPGQCVGCAACEINCPVEALQMEDVTDTRRFSHAASSCLVCGLCFAQCPENAVRLYHGFGWRALTGGYLRREIRTAPLVRCSQCGAVCGPAEQLAVVSRQTGKTSPGLCSDCRHKEQMPRIFSIDSQTPPMFQEEPDGRDCRSL